MNKEKLGKVGGQAVIEGVMMQSQDYKAVAVRKSNGEIEVKKEKIKSAASKRGMSVNEYINCLIDNDLLQNIE